MIIYSSVYGSARRYAEHLGSITGMTVVSADTLRFLPDDDILVYVAGLYAGGMRGLRKHFGKYNGSARLIFVSVGISDPEIENTRADILAIARQQLPPKVFSSAQFFHLRGALDYSKLSAGHSIMMKLMKAALSKKKELDPSDEAFLLTYGKKVDFIDYSKLEPIANAIMYQDKEAQTI